jgi:DnaD/phage-associated family protein
MGEFQPVLKQKHKEIQKRRNEDEHAHHLLTIYEQNIGKLGPIVQDELMQWGALVGEPLVVQETLKQATKFGGRTFTYLEMVLQEWKAASLITLDAV